MEAATLEGIGVAVMHMSSPFPLPLYHPPGSHGADATLLQSDLCLQPRFAPQLQAGNLPQNMLEKMATMSAQKEQLAAFWREQMAEIQQVHIRLVVTCLVGAQ